MRTRADYYSLRACPRCSKVYQAGLRTEEGQPCPDCIAAEKRERAYVPRPPGNNRVPECRLITDPSGDYLTGAAFDWLEFIYGLETDAWDAGTVFEHKGRRWTAIGNGLAESGGKIYHYQNFGLVEIKEEQPCKRKTGRPRKHPAPTSASA